MEGGVEHHDGEGENVGRVLRLKHTPFALTYSAAKICREHAGVPLSKCTCEYMRY